MITLGRRYAHVPLGLVSVLLVVVLIAWLLERRVDGVWEAALRIAGPVPVAVTLAAPLPLASPVAASSDVPPAADVLVLPAEPPPVPAPAPVAVAPPLAGPAGERYVLESGPFLSAEAADRVEDQLNHLGYPTVRFRKQEVRRLYVVRAVGLASVGEAQRAADELGRGLVVEGEGGVELIVERLATLGEAIVAARPVRARGFEVRIDDAASPVVIYHVRYGQFASQGVAEARGEELALFGLVSRVVKTK
jgi:SPOR domain